jgi:hypothetical protein
MENVSKEMGTCHIERYGIIQNIRDERYDAAMVKCQKAKSQQWCEQIVGGFYGKTTFVVDAIHNTVLKLKFNALLIKLKYIMYILFIAPFLFVVPYKLIKLQTKKEKILLILFGLVLPYLFIIA